MSKLQPDDWMLDELFAKGSAFVCIFDTFFEAHPREAEALNDDTNAFVVKVRHDD